MALPSILPFIFSIFCVAVAASKFIRLATHVADVPILAFLLYFPTFLLSDILVICVARLLLWSSPSRLLWIPNVFGFFSTILALAGASSQLSFFDRTGGELEWHEASSYVTSRDGLKVLLTGSVPMMIFAGVIMGIGLVLRNILYNAAGSFVTTVWQHVTVVTVCKGSRGRTPRGSTLMAGDNESNSNLSTYSDLPSDGSLDSEDDILLGGEEKTYSNGSKSLWHCIFLYSAHWVAKLGLLLFLAVALLVRPSKPYDHMTVTLPISLLDVITAGPRYCTEQLRIMRNDWPFPELLDSSLWEQPHNGSKGWAPGEDSVLVEEYHSRTPDWLPENVPLGFFRWDPLRFANGYLGSHLPGPNSPGPHSHEPHGHGPHGHGPPRHGKQKRPPQCPGLTEPDPFYNPVNDPLKISNLDSDILAPIKEALENGEVKIKNVVFILMESLREDLFPLRKDSAIAESILKFNAENDREAVADRLSLLTPHHAQLAGLSSNFGSSAPSPDLVWNDTARPGYGGINVQGAYTTSTMSTKSFAVNHCGAWAMPVEKFEEAETFSYQPCLPQIMDLWNQGKTDDHTDEFTEQKWYPALFQAVTEEYDRQERFDEKIGFKYTMTKTQLMEGPRYNKSDPLYQFEHYFGFSEPVLKPYIRDYIVNATASGQRMYMTHFTSTTHHSWDTPDWFETTDYLPTGGFDGWHSDFNKYLNTIRFHDAWVGELMQLLEDLGVANETLVVFAGDHGQAFKEDYHKTGTYEVGHISDFRVPINFRHPNLPRVQLTASKATTVSVLPTILDLLIHSGSLGEGDRAVAEDIIQDYEGQSLIRPYRASHGGRRAWNFAVINSGAGMLAVTSADTTYRLVMPLNKVFEYRLTELASDPQEHHPIKAWSWESFTSLVETKLGPDAVQWATEAEAVARWWGLERQRLWRYHAL